MTLPVASQKGFEKAKQVVDVFASDLLDEAGRIAKRFDAEEASAEHVRSAAEHLYRSGGNWRSQVLSTAGGVITGLAGSAMFSYLVAESPNTSAIAISAVTTVLAAIATTVGLMRR